MKQILDTAVAETEFLDVNPLAAVKPPKNERKEPRFLTAVDVEKLRRAMIDRDDVGSATLVPILAYVGIRTQDALGLEWTHIGTDLQVVQKNTDGTIRPGSKTGLKYRRRVNLPGPVRADLEGWKKESEASEDGLVFPRAKDGNPWRTTDYKNWQRRAFAIGAQEAGLGKLNPYDLRHTAASLLAAAGWNHLEIANQLGHSPETSVKVYQHLIPVEFGERQAIDKWIIEARSEVAVAEKLPQG